MPSVERFRRLDQLFSQLGYGSRSDVEEWLRTGRVEVVGQPKARRSDRVDPELVRVDGEAVDNPDGLLVLLNKPVGYVCSHDAREGHLVYDLLPDRWRLRSPQVTSIGRLDKDTSGLLILTDRRALVHQLTSPKHHVTKTYAVDFEGSLPEDAVALFSSGTLFLPEEPKPCLPAKLERLSATSARVEIIEGRYHQVRRMFACLGATVVRLRRTNFAHLDLGGVPEGRFRLLPLDSFFGATQR